MMRKTALLAWASCCIIVAPGCSSDSSEAVPTRPTETVDTSNALWGTTIAADEHRGGQLMFNIENRSSAPVVSPMYLTLQSREPTSDWTTVGYLPYSGAGAVTKLCIDLGECEIAASYTEIPAGGNEIWWLPRSVLPLGEYRALVPEIEPEAQDPNLFQLV